MTVHIFIPCFIDQLYPQVGFSMVKVLEKAGCMVVYNPNQTCCGQPAFNAGFWKEARPVCEKFAADFADAACIVTPSASCTGFICNYAEKLFEEDGQAAASGIRSVKEKLFELSDFLVHTPGLKPLDARLEATVTYHDSCAALRECHIKQEPRMLLQQVKGLQLTEMEDVETCCGFGGSFAVKFEPISIAMADQKITHAQATGARYIVSTDMSCLMHLEGRLQHLESPVKVLHLAEVLAAGL